IVHDGGVQGIIQAGVFPKAYRKRLFALLDEQEVSIKESNKRVRTMSSHNENTPIPSAWIGNIGRGSKKAGGSGSSKGTGGGSKRATPKSKAKSFGTTTEESNVLVPEQQEQQQQEQPQE